MLIVGISGSPRKNGNSEKIIDEALSIFARKGAQTESIKLSQVNITPCIHCNFCAENGYCAQDEEANKANAIIEKADGIIVASPVYFGSLSGQLKCLMDKTLPLRRKGFFLKGKIGAALASGNSRNGGQELTIKDIHAWMLVHGMVVVGDNNHFGGTIQKDFENDEFGQKTFEGTIAAMNDLLQKIK